MIVVGDIANLAADISNQAASIGNQASAIGNQASAVINRYGNIHQYFPFPWFHPKLHYPGIGLPTGEAPRIFASAAIPTPPLNPSVSSPLPWSVPVNNLIPSVRR
jgi:hypothetical protein